MNTLKTISIAVALLWSFVLAPSLRAAGPTDPSARLLRDASLSSIREASRKRRAEGSVGPAARRDGASTKLHNNATAILIVFKVFMRLRQTERQSQIGRAEGREG